ncbi:hypothetical protein V490_00389 [Pseudogymnoascus sp. VKM F-3557]|nr:hypothetical protein V490_00389 [Pseudogymnoascus sp. VKM F-3557]
MGDDLKTAELPEDDEQSKWRQQGMAPNDEMTHDHANGYPAFPTLNTNYLFHAVSFPENCCSVNMATKQVLATHAIAALKEHTRKFEVMSVQLAKSADLATNQAAEIAKLTLRLINAMTKIQRDTQRDATARREYLRDKLRSLAAQAVSTKRKILDTAELESSRTIKANFRLIFGPPRESEYKSRSAKSVIATNLIRITTIRSLCESNPHSVIALSTTYPTKVWTESSPEVFDGIIELVKGEKEQDWPEEIVDIINELKAERPMSAEIELLRATILQRKDRRRRRTSDSDGPAREIAPLPPMQTGELATRTPSGQYTSGTTQLPSLQQMVSFNRGQTQGLTGRQIDYRCSEAPISLMPLLGDPLFNAVADSNQWKWERRVGGPTSDCMNAMVPQDRSQDISITLSLDHKKEVPQALKRSLPGERRDITSSSIEASTATMQLPEAVEEWKRPGADEKRDATMNQDVDLIKRYGETTASRGDGRRQRWTALGDMKYMAKRKSKAQ